MQVINFVPQDYIKRKRARKANLLCATLAAIVAVAMAVTLTVINASTGEIDQVQEQMDQKLQKAAEDIAAWKTLQKERQTLLERAESDAKLMNPLPQSRVVGEVIQALPSAAALTELHVVEQTVKVIEADTSSPKPGRRARKAAQVVREKVETRLRLIGLAPTDVEVAGVISSLSASPLFDRVELSYSENQAVAGVVVRKFEVTFILRDEAPRIAQEQLRKGELL